MQFARLVKAQSEYIPPITSFLGVESGVSYILNICDNVRRLIKKLALLQTSHPRTQLSIEITDPFTCQLNTFSHVAQR